MKIETTAVYYTCYSRRSIKLIVAFFQSACLREYVRLIEGDRIESMSALDLPGWTPDPLECRRSCRRTDPFQRSDECHSPPSPLATLNSSLICRARRISGMDPRLPRNELVFSFPIYVHALAKYRDKRCIVVKACLVGRKIKIGGIFWT